MRKLLIVAMIVPNKLGAFERWMVATTRYGRDHGIEVHFLLAGAPHPEIDAEIHAFGGHVHIASGWLQCGDEHAFRPFLAHYRRLSHQLKFEAVAFHFCRELHVALALLLAHGKGLGARRPRTTWVQHNEVKQSRLPVLRNFPRLKLIAPVLDGIVTLYEGAAAALGAKGVPAQRLRVIYNGVAAAGVELEQIARLRSELGVAPGEVMLFTASSLIARKNLAVMIAGVGEAVRQVPLKLFIAGLGDQQAQLEAQVAELGLKDHVKLLGSRSDVPELIAACDFGLLTADSEALPFFCIEALAQGKTVVATPAGGTTEIIHHEETGLIVPFRDPAAVGAAIVRLVQDPTLRRRFEANAAAAYHRHFSLDAMVRAHLECYLGLRK